MTDQDEANVITLAQFADSFDPSDFVLLIGVVLGGPVAAFAWGCWKAGKRYAKRRWWWVVLYYPLLAGAIFVHDVWSSNGYSGHGMTMVLCVPSLVVCVVLVLVAVRDGPKQPT